MKLYTSLGPNPHVVRMFMAERNISLPSEEIDIMAGANRQPPYLDVNPAGQMPALQLDDGSVITEITAICEYLDEKFPGPSLIGATPEERAQTRRWTRFIDLNIVEPLTNGFRYAEGLPLFQSRMRCIPEAASGLKAVAQDKLAWLNAQMEGKAFVTGERITLADVLLFAFLTFGARVGQPLNPEHAAIAAWHARMAQRPSANA